MSGFLPPRLSERNKADTVIEHEAANQHPPSEAKNKQPLICVSKREKRPRTAFVEQSLTSAEGLDWEYSVQIHCEQKHFGCMIKT